MRLPPHRCIQLLNASKMVMMDAKRGFDIKDNQQLANYNATIRSVYNLVLLVHHIGESDE